MKGRNKYAMYSVHHDQLDNFLPFEVMYTNHYIFWKKLNIGVYVFKW